MNSSQPRIALLMPTFNSAKFLREQIDSLLTQTYQNFVIVTRDDGSSDSSRDMIEAYAKIDPYRFQVMVRDGENLGASGTFARLLTHAMQHQSQPEFQFSYVMFCDHDDVWYPHKIAVTLSRMQALEVNHAGEPLLVHSDLKVVDGERCQIAPSFVQYQGIKPRRNGFARLLVCNTVTGCTAMINNELATRMLPIPEGAMMHDWWMALVASAFGEIDYIDEALLDYRQHGANTLGAREYRQSGGQNFLARLLDDQQADEFRGRAAQARAFRDYYGSRLNAGQSMAIALTCLLKLNVPPLQRLVMKLLQV